MTNRSGHTASGIPGENPARHGRRTCTRIMCGVVASPATRCQRKLTCPRRTRRDRFVACRPPDAARAAAPRSASRRGRQRRHVSVLRPRPRRRRGVSRLRGRAGRRRVAQPGRSAKRLISPSCWWWSCDRRRRAGAGVPGTVGRQTAIEHTAPDVVARVTDAKTPSRRAISHRRRRAAAGSVATTPPEGGYADFDPVASLPWAMAIGRAWALDAVLTRIDVGRVSATGWSISAARRAAATASSRRAGTSAGSTRRTPAGSR